MSDNNWKGGDVETPITKLEGDEGGNPIIMRTLTFKFPPDIEEKDYPTEDDIAHQQLNTVQTFLWKDELVLIEKLRVTIDKGKRLYYVHAICQARKGGELRETPDTLEDIAKDDT